MYLLVFLRFLLGLMPRTVAVVKSIKALRDMVVRHPREARLGLRLAVRHEWMSMDHLLIGSYTAFAHGERCAFEDANHPLRRILRFAWRLARGSEPYPALAAVVLLRDARRRRM